MKEKETKIKYIINILLTFIILQPVFDVLSNLANNGYVSFNIITYLKPFVVFSIYLFLFFFYKYRNKTKQFIFYLFIMLYIIAHSILLYVIYVKSPVILHEVRFLINIIYFITMFLNLYNISNIVSDKEKFYKKLKNALVIAFGLYVLLYICSVLTGTSWFTYEFADKNKLGFRGWNYSGQILGHLLCIILPILLFTINSGKINKFLKVVLILLSTIPFILIGTKVSYFILLIVNALNILIIIFYKILHHSYKINILAIFTSIMVILLGVSVYKISPVYHNILLNNAASSGYSSEEDINKYANEMKETAEKNKKDIEESRNSGNLVDVIKTKFNLIITPENREKIALQYEDWTIDSLDKLNKMYESNKLHAADTRNRQFYFLHFKYMLSSPLFKLLGLGYLNQPNGLSIERDIIMPLYAFGIIGFILLTGILWFMFGKTIYSGIKNARKLDIETILLCESYFMFLFISFYAGYTYIYTQFSIILAVIMCMLNLKINQLYEKRSKNEKD